MQLYFLPPELDVIKFKYYLNLYEILKVVHERPSARVLIKQQRSRLILIESVVIHAKSENRNLIATAAIFSN